MLDKFLKAELASTRFGEGTWCRPRSGDGLR